MCADDCIMYAAPHPPQRVSPEVAVCCTAGVHALERGVMKPSLRACVLAGTHTHTLAHISNPPPPLSHNTTHTHTAGVHALGLGKLRSLCIRWRAAYAAPHPSAEPFVALGLGRLTATSPHPAMPHLCSTHCRCARPGARRAALLPHGRRGGGHQQGGGAEQSMKGTFISSKGPCQELCGGGCCCD